jgi:hypothetical protein
MEKAERVEVALEIYPLTVDVKNTLALRIRAVGFCDSGAGAAIGSFGFRGHDFEVMFSGS